MSGLEKKTKCKKKNLKEDLVEKFRNFISSDMLFFVKFVLVSLGNGS